MIRRFIRDEHGSAIVENTITMLVFVLLTMGITQAGLIMWSFVGLEHGVEMAARCASVSDAAIDAGLDWTSATYQYCYTTNTKGASHHTSTVKAYAASNSWGSALRPPPSPLRLLPVPAPRPRLPTKSAVRTR
jgi:Flp pilus assembly protein TadG